MTGSRKSKNKLKMFFLFFSFVRLREYVCCMYSCHLSIAMIL